MPRRPIVKMPLLHSPQEHLPVTFEAGITITATFLRRDRFLFAVGHGEKELRFSFGKQEGLALDVASAERERKSQDV